MQASRYLHIMQHKLVMALRISSPNKRDDLERLSRGVDEKRTVSKKNVQENGERDIKQEERGRSSPTPHSRSILLADHIPFMDPTVVQSRLRVIFEQDYEAAIEDLCLVDETFGFRHIQLWLFSGMRGLYQHGLCHKQRGGLQPNECFSILERIEGLQERRSFLEVSSVICFFDEFFKLVCDILLFSNDTIVLDFDDQTLMEPVDETHDTVQGIVNIRPSLVYSGGRKGHEEAPIKKSLLSGRYAPFHSPK